MNLSWSQSFFYGFNFSLSLGITNCHVHVLTCCTCLSSSSPPPPPHPATSGYGSKTVRLGKDSIKVRRDWTQVCSTKSFARVDQTLQDQISVTVQLSSYISSQVCGVRYWLTKRQFFCFVLQEFDCCSLTLQPCKNPVITWVA